MSDTLNRVNVNPTTVQSSHELGVYDAASHLDLAITSIRSKLAYQAGVIAARKAAQGVRLLGASSTLTHEDRTVAALDTALTVTDDAVIATVGAHTDYHHVATIGDKGFNCVTKRLDPETGQIVEETSTDPHAVIAVHALAARCILEQSTKS